MNLWTELTCTVHNVLKYLAHSFMLICTSTMMSGSSTRDSYVVKRPIMTITYCRNSTRASAESLQQSVQNELTIHNNSLEFLWFVRSSDGKADAPDSFNQASTASTHPQDPVMERPLDGQLANLLMGNREASRFRGGEEGKNAVEARANPNVPVHLPFGSAVSACHVPVTNCMPFIHCTALPPRA